MSRYNNIKTSLHLEKSEINKLLNVVDGLECLEELLKLFATGYYDRCSCKEKIKIDNFLEGIKKQIEENL